MEGYINEDVSWSRVNDVIRVVLIDMMCVFLFVQVPLDVVKQVTVPNTTSTSASSSSTTQTKRAKLDDEKTVVNDK